MKDTGSNFLKPTTFSGLCSVHFTPDSFKEQTVITLSLGLKMKCMLKSDAIPSIFKSGPPQNKDDKTTMLLPDHPKRSRYKELIGNKKLQGTVI